MPEPRDRLEILETEIERRLAERFAALREEFDRLRREADSRWAGFVSRFDQRLTGVVPGELLTAAASGPPEAGFAHAAEAARELDSATTQAEALDRFLRLSLSHACRAVVLVLREGSFSVWQAAGFSDEQTEALRRVSLPASFAGFSGLIEGDPCRLGRGSSISERLFSSDAADAVIVPIVIKERVAGALYADAAPGTEKRFDPEALGFLTFFALVLERLGTRKLIPAPALRAPRRVSASRPLSDSAPGLPGDKGLDLWREFVGETKD